MKRSEMQESICKLLEEQSRQGTAFMFKAQQILELIEKVGMLIDERDDVDDYDDIDYNGDYEFWKD